MSNSYLFTSESVSEGHPDKVSDQISDAVLDAIHRGGHECTKVACETLVKTGMVVVAGEVTTDAYIELEDLVRSTVLDIGYNDSAMGFDGASCAVLNALGKQSPDIRTGCRSRQRRGTGCRRPGIDVRLRQSMKPTC